MNDLSRGLAVEKVALKKHLVFDLYEFKAFWKSENGEALEFPMPYVSVPFAVVPYFAALEVILFRARRYFVTLDNRIVGLFAVKPKQSLLVITNLAVLPEARRHRIGFYMLDQIRSLAAELGLKGLRLRVLKKNIPARQLYMKYGFRKKEETRLSLKLEKRLQDT